MGAFTGTRIHFIGIGGIGMSALARFFLHEGKVVSGSDRSPSVITDALTKEGATIYSPQVAANITPDIELVVYTEAMAPDQEEMVAARALNVPMVNYFEALGMVANQYYLIAVAGSHGKTTTTAMLIDILEAAGLDPTAIVGSLRAKTGSNFRPGKSQYAIVEACEYKRDFLHLRPDVLVITNVEAEHLDYYTDIDDVISAFNELVRLVPESGIVVCNLKDPVTVRVIEGVVAQVSDYMESLDLLMSMKQPGMHNRMNAAAAVAAAGCIGISTEKAKESISNFVGTWRRFEYRGLTPQGAVVYDDYGHHPSEIRATIAGARELYPGKLITVVFQPHLYSRTKVLAQDFVAALGGAGDVLLLPIYAAREPHDPTISSEILARMVAEHCPGIDPKVFDTFEAAARWLRMVPKEESVIITMGASDLYKLADMLVQP